jgi:ELWxxDGT repeat protein
MFLIREKYSSKKITKPMKVKKTLINAMILIAITNTVVLSSVHGQIIQLVKEINTAPGGSSNPHDKIVTNNKLFFIATDNAGVSSLWVTDGTGSNTLLLGPTSSVGNSIANLAAYNNKIYFSYNDGVNGTEPWVSDGTVAGTVMFIDINPGAGHSFPQVFTVVNNKLFFAANNNLGLTRLFVSDGTAAGTIDMRPASVLSGSKNFASLVNDIYFLSDDGSGNNGLWKCDGTLGGTLLVKGNITPNTAIPGYSAVLNSKLYFSANDPVNGTELWSTDGTTAGTVIVKDLNGASSGNPQNLRVFNSKIYFAANDVGIGNELFVTDGTAAGTQLVKDVVPGTSSSQPYESTVFNGFLYFMCWATSEMWKTDGTTNGTTLVKNLGFSSPKFAATWNGEMYIVFGGVTDIFQSDGTTAGTTAIAVTNTSFPISSNAGFGGEQYFTDYNAELYFAANCFGITSGFELCKLTLGALPLRLISFTGSTDNTLDILKWTTQNEINTSHFIIEQSDGGNLFSPVSKVTAAGNGTGSREYIYSRQAGANAVAYYRLRMMDINGTATYSEIIKISHKNNNNTEARYYSIEHKLEIINRQQSSCTWRLIAMNGSLVKQGKSADAFISIPLQNISAGIYLLSYQANNTLKNIEFSLY